MAVARRGPNVGALEGIPSWHAEDLDPIPRAEELAQQAEERDLHIGHLFSSAGFPALKILVIEMDATRTYSHTQNGWQYFAHCLGGKQTFTKALENQCYSREGPTVAILIDREEVGLNCLLRALIKMERLDILTKIRWELEDFFQKVDVHSLPKGLLPKPLASCKSYEEWISHMPIHHQPSLPPAGNPGMPPTETREAPRVVTQNRQRVDVVVLLTHGPDGIRESQEVAQKIRQYRSNKRSIGVFLFEENRTELECDPIVAAENLYRQVRYVLPIVTPGYLSSLAPTEPNRQLRSWAENLDVILAPHIFRLMQCQFLTDNWCKNRHVRCIVPDCYRETVPRRPDFKNKIIFGSWWGSSELHVLLESILRK